LEKVPESDRTVPGDLLFFDLGHADDNGDGNQRFDLCLAVPEADIYGVDALDLDEVLADLLFNIGEEGGVLSSRYCKTPAPPRRSWGLAT